MTLKGHKAFPGKARGLKNEFLLRYMPKLAVAKSNRNSIIIRPMKEGTEVSKIEAHQTAWPVLWDIYNSNVNSPCSTHDLKRALWWLVGERVEVDPLCRS